MIRPANALIAALACFLLGFFCAPTNALAHGGVSIEDDLCVISIGYYDAHFKIYQPQNSGHEQFCEDLPAVGQSVFVMDYSHAELSDALIDFRIVRNETGKGRFTKPDDLGPITELEALTVFHAPAATSTEVYTAYFEFAESGEFIGIVTVTQPGTGKVQSAVFPFEVGFAGFGYWPWFIALALIVQLQYWFSSRRTRKQGAHRRSVARNTASISFLICVLALPAWGLDEQSWISNAGLYRVSYTSELDPLEINRIHHWIVHLETADGEPVPGARIAIEGGMPRHDHGLPTRPLVTEVMGNGNYKIDGMRFHMNGEWELVITIEDANTIDTVVIEVTL